MWRMISEEYFQRALEVEPNNRHHAKTYAWFLWNIKEDKSKAAEYLSRAQTSFKIHWDIVHFVKVQEA